DRCVALTEVPLPITFDPDTLQTLGVFHYDERLEGQLSTAHPHFDFGSRRAFNYLAQLGRVSRYHIFAVAAAGGRRDRAGSVTAAAAAYMHSFALTERYVVLVEFPLVGSPLQVLLGRLWGRPFIENCRWRPERGTRFWVIGKSDGAVVARAEA